MRAITPQLREVMAMGCWLQGDTVASSNTSQGWRAALNLTPGTTLASTLLSLPTDGTRQTLQPLGKLGHIATTKDLPREGTEPSDHWKMKPFRLIILYKLIDLILVHISHLLCEALDADYTKWFWWSFNFPAELQLVRWYDDLTESKATWSRY